MSKPDKNDQITVNASFDGSVAYGGGLSSSLTVGPDADPARMREVADVLTLMAAQLNARALAAEGRADTVRNPPAAVESE